eukprot:gene357-550_t
MGLFGKIFKIKKRHDISEDVEMVPSREHSPSDCSTMPSVNKFSKPSKRSRFARRGRSETIVEITPFGTHIVINAPFTLGFVGVCFLVRLLSSMNSSFGDWFASPKVQRMEKIIDEQIPRATILQGATNATTAQRSGRCNRGTPMLEEKYDSILLLKMSAVTAVVTALVNCFISRQVVLGASGLVFQNIVLSSFTSVKAGQIPMTLILTSLFHMSAEIKSLLFGGDGHVSNFSHILGGIMGAYLGYKHACKHNYDHDDD